MYRPPDFREDRPEALHAAIRAHRLATLITCGPSDLIADLWLAIALRAAQLVEAYERPFAAGANGASFVTTKYVLTKGVSGVQVVRNPSESPTASPALTSYSSLVSSLRILKRPSKIRSEISP